MAVGVVTIGDIELRVYEIVVREDVGLFTVAVGVVTLAVGLLHIDEEQFIIVPLGSYLAMNISGPPAP